PDLDFLVALTPLTAETRGIVGAKVLAAMKPTAYVVNVARGGVVDEPALIAALESGKIAGAALDVFAQEPLPANSPLWKTKNVTIFSHLGGYSQGYEERAMPTIAGNMAKFLSGDIKSMINIVRKPAYCRERTMPLSERLNTPISSAELERRWRAVRAAMEKEKIDVLLMQNNNDHMGGYVRYFTDMPATNGYPNTVVFPRNDEMTVVCQGPFGGNEATAQGDQNWRGVKRILTTPSYASAHYTKEYDPELAATALKPFAQATIGYVGTYQMSYALLDYMKRAFPQARFVDASEMVDRIKVIKSAEEMELVKRAALMQDGAMRAAFAAAKPGMRDTEVAAVAQHYSQCHGSENGIYLCASMPLGKPSKFANRHLQNRVIQKGDQIALLVEDNGPGGMFTELG